MTMQFMEQLHRRQFGQDGVVSPSFEGQSELAARWLTESPGARQWWREWSRVFAPDFREYIDGLIGGGDEAD